MPLIFQFSAGNIDEENCEITVIEEDKDKEIYREYLKRIILSLEQF